MLRDLSLRVSAGLLGIVLTADVVAASPAQGRALYRVAGTDDPCHDLGRESDTDSSDCPARAQTDTDTDGDGVPDGKDACPKQPGVRSSDPKTSGCPARADAGKIKDEAEVTFSGYRSLPGNRGIVFVELTSPVAVEVSRRGQVIEYKLVGASVPLKNNKNPLLLRDFASSAMTAQLVPDKKSVRLVITLRANVDPSYRMVAHGKGAALEVELPPKPNVNAPR